MIKNLLSDEEKVLINSYYENFIGQNFRKLRYTSSETSVQFIIQLSLSIWLFQWGPILTQEDKNGKMEQIKFKETYFDPIIYYYGKITLNVLGVLSSAYGTINQTMFTENLHVRKHSKRTSDFYKSTAKLIKK